MKGDANRRSTLADAWATAAAELAAEGGGSFDVAAQRNVISTALKILDVIEAAGPGGQDSPSCHVTRTWTEKCDQSIEPYQAPNTGPREPIAWGGQLCTPCVNGVRTCYEYECRIQVQG
jgi:hypothetical protein